VAAPGLTPASGDTPVLELDGLTVEIATPGGTGLAVDRLSLRIHAGETLCIVGESGSGKSITALAIMGLLTSPPARVSAGRVLLEGRDLLTMADDALNDIRGRRMSMIFQEPMSSLNPVLTVGYQIAEVVRRHEGLPRKACLERAVEMLTLVRIPEPRRRAAEFPHQMSGGMRQRVMIAMALACNPRLLIADEPTTALDVTIQAQVMELMRELRERLGMAVLLITHDMGVVAENADSVVVMYAGRKVEEAEVQDLFARPTHPYTRALLRSMPQLADSGGRRTGRRPRLSEIPGIVPSLVDIPAGCAFAPRCNGPLSHCAAERPALEWIAPGHARACWREPGTLEPMACP
jgi:peptide/nickel transport system ATP-binding protein